MLIPTVRIPANNAQGYKIVNADDPRANQAEPRISREDVAAMKKGDVRELLEAHGVTDIPKAVGDMRELLTQIMFLEV